MEFFYGAFTDEWERRKAALLHEMATGKKDGADEDEFKRRTGGGGLSLARPGSMGAGRGWRTAGRRSGRSETTRPMAVRFSGIAKGSQPAVVKMASYGGGVRLGAMLNYVSRSGDIEVEDDRGERIDSKERLSSLRSEWEHLFQNREESRDIGVFSVSIEAIPDRSGDELQALVEATLSRGFGSRRFAFGIARSGNDALAVEGVIVLRASDGERLTGDAKAASIVQERYDTRSSANDPSAVFSFSGYGNGVDYGTSRLRRLVEKFDGVVRDERGQTIENDIQAGDLVQKDWRHELHSRKSRDVMHLILSARAGTDVEAFQSAAREFLAEQFSGHRYVFALHDPTQDPKEEADGGKRPHVHVHAIITMRSEFGERIETSPKVFRDWRHLMAEKAREHGIQMEMTDRRELANAPAFGRNQVRPLNRQGRTEHVGTSEAAQSRYDAKRTEQPTAARAPRSFDYTIKARDEWRKLAMVSGDRKIVAYAEAKEKRIETAFEYDRATPSLGAAGADFGSKYEANMVLLEKIVSEADNMPEMSRPEFEAYEKRVETVLFKFEQSIATDERADFDEIASAARDHVDVRREILELSEERSGLRATETEADRLGEQYPGDVAKYGRDQAIAGHGAFDRIAQAEINARAAEHRGEDIQPFKNAVLEAIDEAARLAFQGNAFIRDNADDGIRAAMGGLVREEASLTGQREHGDDTPRDESNDRWEEAVAMHGAEVVERANDLLIEVDAARERIDRARADGRRPDAAELDHARALGEAARLAVAGNSFMREVAESDGDLRRAVDAAERSEGGKNAATAADAAARALERNRDDDRGSDTTDDRASDDVAPPPGEKQNQPLRPTIELEGSRGPGETNRTDPAQQHIPRLEDLRREAEQQKDRDRERDDHER
ncbi:MAG: conjugal transfer protein TraA [Mesorhizobium sp.]